MLCVFLILVEGLTSAFCILAKKPFDSFSGGWDQSPDNHVVIISYLSLSLFFPEIIFPPLKACNHHGSHMITPSDPASPDLTLFSTPLPLSPPPRPSLSPQSHSKKKKRLGVSLPLKPTLFLGSLEKSDAKSFCLDLLNLLEWTRALWHLLTQAGETVLIHKALTYNMP